MKSETAFRKRGVPSSGFPCHRALRLLLTVLIFSSIPAHPLFSTDAIQETLEFSSFSDSEQSAILVNIEKAREVGIPDEFLLPRLREAISKKVPFPAITGMLNRETEAFSTALNMLEEAGYGDPPDTLEWQRTAHLLLSGIQQQHINLMLTVFRDSRTAYRPGTSLYLSLIKWGLSAGDAVALVEAAAASAIEPGNYTGIMELLSTSRKKLIRTDEMIKRLIEVLPKSRSIDFLEERVIF